MDFPFEVNTSTDFSYPGIKKKRLPGEPRLKPGPRPTKRPRKYQPRKAPTRLRKDRPLQTIISHDIWENILIFCPLDKLLKLRTLCHSFHSTLSSDRVWKQARLNHYGPNIPDPPKGMKEMDYADLLAAVGCQNPKCSERCTRRAYWAFRRRWCERCCNLNVLKERQAKEEVENFDVAKNCIPFAMYDSWSHYQWAGKYDSPPSWTGTYGAQTLAFSKLDLQRFNDRYTDLLASSPSPEAVAEWLSDEADANTKYMKQLQKIESWVMSDAKDRESERVVVKAKRAAFFKEKAAQLQSPLDIEALRLCPSFIKSAEIAKLPTEKSWQILKFKLQTERKEAEDMLVLEKCRKEREHYQRYLSANYNTIYARRLGQSTPEQILVLRLADQVIHDILVDPSGIDDSDITSVVLRGVYDAYERLDDSEKPQCSAGQYRLILDDARLVYDTKVAPLTEFLPTPERQRAARYLFCPVSGCRTSHQVPYDFHSLTKHLINHQCIMNYGYLEAPHGCLASTDLLFGWHIRAWPPNLPMRSIHQNPQHVWQADAEATYQPTVKPGRPLLDDLTDGTLGKDILHLKDEFPMDRTQYAASLVERLPINLVFKANILLEYIRWQALKHGGRSRLFFKTVPSARTDLHHLSNLYQDQCCVRCQHQNPLETYALVPRGFVDLAQHYAERHATDDPFSPAHSQLLLRMASTHDSLKEALSPVSARSSEYDLDASGVRDVSPISDLRASASPLRRIPSPGDDLGGSSFHENSPLSLSRANASPVGKQYSVGLAHFGFPH